MWNKSGVGIGQAAHIAAKEYWSDKIEDVLQLVENGFLIEEIADKYSCSHATIRQKIKDNGVELLSVRLRSLCGKDPKIEWVNYRLAHKGLSLGDRWKFITTTEIPVQCPVLGIPLDYSRGGKTYNSDSTPSIDRIDSLSNYTLDNIQIMSVKANRIKNNATLEELIKIGKWAEKVKNNEQ